MPRIVTVFHIVLAIAITGVFGLAAERAQAVPLQDLIDGGSITVADKLFDEWSVFDQTGLMPNFSLVEVTGLDDDPNNPGVKFSGNGELTVTDFDFIDFTLGFRVSTVSGEATIKDNSLELTDFSFGGDGGFINIQELILDLNDEELGEKEVLADNAGQEFVLFDSADFIPQSEIFVEKTVVLLGDFTGDVVELGMFTQRFSQVTASAPEPTTLVLLGLGLVGIGWKRRAKGRA